MGRPSSITPEIADIICDRLADGESLRDICKDESLPSRGAVFRALAKDEDFRNQYARAREEQADTLADEVISIADDGTNDWMEKHGKDDIGWQLNQEHVQRSRLRLDARKWYAGKLAPKKYGDKITQELTGANGGAIVIHSEDVSALQRYKDKIKGEADGQGKRTEDSERQ